MKIDSLTKEEFWNDLMEKYPAEMKEFCAWVDEYKKRVDWDDLFYNHLAGARRNSYWMNIKYHHIPVAMQIGIFLQYVSESNKHDFPFLVKDSKSWELLIEDISWWFKSVNELDKPIAGIIETDNNAY